MVEGKSGGALVNEAKVKGWQDEISVHVRPYPHRDGNHDGRTLLNLRMWRPSLHGKISVRAPMQVSYHPQRHLGKLFLAARMQRMQHCCRQWKRTESLDHGSTERAGKLREPDFLGNLSPASLRDSSTH